jgi:hypothetical protein
MAFCLFWYVAPRKIWQPCINRLPQKSPSAQKKFDENVGRHGSERKAKKLKLGGKKNRQYNIQGCQIFVGTSYQNRKMYQINAKFPKRSKKLKLRRKRIGSTISNYFGGQGCQIFLGT